MYKGDPTAILIGKAGALSLHIGVLDWPVKVLAGQCPKCLAVPV